MPSEDLTIVDNRTGREYTLPIVDGTIRASALDPDALRRIAGEEAVEAAEAQHGHADTWVARAPRGIAVREGDRTELGVDTKLLHFFDLETGGALHDAAA